MILSQKKLKHLLCGPIRNGYSPVCVDEPTSKAVLGLGALTENGLDLTETKWVPETNEQVDSYTLRAGDFLISRSNTLEKVGRAALYRGGLENCSYPDLMMRFRVDESKMDPSFLEQALKSYPTRRHFMRCASGTSSSMVKITKSILESLDIPTPPIETQKAIANLLSTWDKAIEKTQRLIQAKQSQLKQLSRKLLFGSARLDKQKNGLIEGRFYKYPSDWSLVKVRNVAQEVSLRGGDSVETVLSCSKYDGLVNSLDYFGKQVFSSDTSNYKVIKKGQFGYPSNHIEEGSIGLLEHCELGIVSPIYVVFEVNGDRVHAPYLYKLLKTDVYRHIFQVSTSSSVDRRGSLRWSDFSRLKVPLPPLAEQKEIAEVIYVAEEEIKLLKQLAEKYKVQKRGLMQKLLTGEWRVNADEEVA